MRAINVTELGGPEVLRLAEVPDPAPADEMTLIQVSTAGVNLADTMQTRGQYVEQTALPTSPAVKSPASHRTGGALRRWPRPAVRPSIVYLGVCPA